LPPPAHKTLYGSSRPPSRKFRARKNAVKDPDNEKYPHAATENMDEQRSYGIILDNLDQLVGLMLTVPKGGSVDVFCDAAGKNLSISKPTPTSNLKLCSVTSTDLESHYDVRQRGDGYVTGDGDEIPKDRLRGYLVESIRGMSEGGAEWGWEFKVTE
jgi:hypothetical protein